MTAETNGSSLILATDPDADRLALAERNAITKEWTIFSGNEMGALFSWWAFKTYKDRHPNFNGTYIHIDCHDVLSPCIVVWLVSV